MYFAGIATFAGTIFLGIIAMQQTNHANSLTRAANELSKQNLVVAECSTKISEMSLEAEHAALDEAIRANNNAASDAHTANKINLKSIELAASANAINKEMLQNERVARIWQRVPIMIAMEMSSKTAPLPVEDSIKITIKLQSLINSHFSINCFGIDIVREDDETEPRAYVNSIEAPMYVKPNGEHTVSDFINKEDLHGEPKKIRASINMTNMFGETFFQYMTLILIEVPNEADERPVLFFDYNSKFFYADPETLQYTQLVPYK